MQTYFKELSDIIQSELLKVDMEGCEISIEESVAMMRFFDKHLLEMRVFFLSKESISVQEEIQFFKEMKPDILGMLLYFNKIHTIELKCPNGSNDTQKEYYQAELSSLTYFFERNLDFYQYYRANSTYMDEHYFVRGRPDYQLCVDSAQYMRDPLFSTGFDYKVAKIICNEILRIYLNKKINNLNKQVMMDESRDLLSQKNIKWTASKIAAIELGYSLHSSAVFNNGNADIKDIMALLGVSFNINLGDYYRTYIAIKSRKKERTPFLSKLIENLIKRMENDDSELE